MLTLLFSFAKDVHMELRTYVNSLMCTGYVCICIVTVMQTLASNYFCT